MIFECIAKSNQNLMTPLTFLKNFLYVIEEITGTVFAVEHHEATRVID
jgi:hypothetical protein